MVPILVVVTVAAFIFADWLLERRQKVARQPSLETWLLPQPALATASHPKGLFFHPGHTWARLFPDGLVAVGASDFATAFTGHLARVDVPREGTEVRQGDPGWTLISAARRELTQAMPVDGEIVEVNEELIAHPLLAERNPYDAGWILKLRPKRLRECLSNLIPEGLADSWSGLTLSRVSARLSPDLGALANDGGEWQPGFGDYLSDDDWEAIRHELFPVTDRG
jgi:glycine cleavage system H lipoate-binding protein